MSFEPLVPSGKAGENTWNSRLAERLRKRGFSSADFELQFPILRGRPRKPDIAFADGGTNIISGKLGESKEFEAFSSAQEYQQLIGATTSLGEVFAVVYPASKRESFVLHLLATAEHERSVWRLPSLDEVAGTISEVVQKRIDFLKRPVEPPDASVVRLLRQGVEVLYLYAKNAREERLKEVFGGAEFFDSVLAESLPKTDRRSVLSRAASFLFVNQLLFYCILRRETGLYDDIEVSDMASPQTIRSKYFSHVREKNYAPIFDIDVASLFDPERSKDGCLRVTRVIMELVRSVSTHDLIGKVFHEIIPLEFRKMIAAFYTNSGAGDLLAALAIHDAEARVLDPACGSGTLLVSAYKRKKSLIQGDKTTVEVHRRFVEQQLTGLDVMAFSAHLAAVQLLLQEPLEYTEHLRIGTVDSTTAYPGMKIQPFGETIREAFRQRKLTDFERGRHEVKPSEVVKTGAVAIGRESPESFMLDEADVVIMNPPFTSSRRMMMNYKDELKKRFRSDDRYRRLVKGNVGYHLYFVCVADKFLAENGRLALVMPFTTLVGGDFSELTRFLVSKYSIEYIVCGRGRSAFSENTMFSEILFVAQKRPPKESHRSVLILTKTSPISWSQDDVQNIALAAQECAITGQDLDSELFTTVSFDQEELLPEGKTLTRIVAEADRSYRVASDAIARITSESRLLSTFGELQKSKVLSVKVAEVVHGKTRDSPGHSLTRFGGDALVACRSEERARMKHDRLIYDGKTKRSIRFRDKSTGDVFVIPKDAVVPALRRFAYIDQFELTRKEDLVIAKQFSKLRGLYESMLGHRRAAKALEAFKDEWASIVESGSARLCIPGRLDLAAPGTRLLAIRGNRPIFMCSFMWGISGLSKPDEKIVVLWLNSAVFFCLLLARQTVTRGSWVKLHGKQFARIQVLDPRKLTKDHKIRLLRLYGELSKSEWPSIIEQYKSPSEQRRKLDLEILRVLGVEGKEAERMIQDLYNAISSSLQTMQTTMEAD